MESSRPPKLCDCLQAECEKVAREVEDEGEERWSETTSNGARLVPSGGVCKAPALGPHSSSGAVSAPQQHTEQVEGADIGEGGRGDNLN